MPITLSLDIGENYNDPYDFVEASVLAEEMRFKRVWLGDHFVPWFHSARRSAFVWPVISVALEKTRNLQIGPLVTSPIGGRYHPALVAQMAATIDNMFPQRFLLGVGSGEAINELPFMNGRWPQWKERMDRLVEGIVLMKKLWESNEPFRFEGKYFPSDFCFLYTKPKTKIEVYTSAVGKISAYNAGRYGDHLATLASRCPPDRLAKEIIPKFEEGCKDSGKNKPGKVLVLLESISFSSPEQLLSPESRGSLGYLAEQSWNATNPIEIEKLGTTVTEAQLRKYMKFVKDWGEVRRIVEEYERVGVTELLLYSGADKNLIKDYATNVLSSY